MTGWTIWYSRADARKASPLANGGLVRAQRFCPEPMLRWRLDPTHRRGEIPLLDRFQDEGATDYVAFATLVEESVRDATRRSEVVISTGGLGPTEDDITRKVFARVTGRQLKLDYEVLNGERKSADGFVASQISEFRDPKAVAVMGLETGMGFIPFGGKRTRCIKESAKMTLHP